MRGRTEGVTEKFEREGAAAGGIDQGAFKNSVRGKQQVQKRMRETEKR